MLLTPSFRTTTPRQPKFAVLTRLSSSDRANKAAGQPSRASATSSRRRRHQRTVWGGVGGRVGNHEGREFDVGGASQRGLKARPRRAQRRRWRSAASLPLGVGAGGGRQGGCQGGGRGPGTWELELVQDASSTSGEPANAASEHVHGVRNAAEAVRSLAALLLDGACSASPPPQRRPPSPPRHAKWALTPAHGPELGA